jgi:MFS family permease
MDTETTALPVTEPPTAGAKKRALRFVVLVGIMSFFADFVYEGARSILGPYLAVLGASGAAVGTVAGLGELLGYGLRLVSGRLADRTRLFWPITILGYIIQMAAVPALALAGSWPVAAALLILERVGKATRNPPRDVMLAHAGQSMGGYGWAFGLHEALDQGGALVGPLVVAAVFAHRGEYRSCFAILLVPAIVTLGILALARVLFPQPAELGHAAPTDLRAGLPRVFWIYLGGAALVAAGFADFPIIAFHFQRTGVVTGSWIPLLYAIAMATSGLGSLVWGRLFDRAGLPILIPLTVLGAVFAPLVFLGGFWSAVVGIAIWGLGMGVHESIIPAAVAPMVSGHGRASAYGLFTAGYGIAWFAGSALIGLLYDHSVTAAMAACVLLELAALPFFFAACRPAS